MSDLKDSQTDIGGLVTCEVIRDTPTGPKVIARRDAHNLIVNTGKRQLWRQATGLNTKVFNFMRIGINSVAAGSADTNVKTAIASTLHTCDSKTLLSGTRTFQWVRSYPSGAGGTIISVAAIKEVALLNQLTSPGGSALMRTVFTSVAKTKADKLKISYRSRLT
jgi:hypothetical protein